MADYLAENNYLFQGSFSSSYLYFSNFANKDTSFENTLKTTSDEKLNTEELTDGGANKGNSYTRIVSASVMTSELRTTTGENGITAFSYQGVMQQFEIRIDVNGDDRKYTAIGTDKGGEPFEKEIDPYNVEPTDADFTEFAALCSYIRETENLADETMKFVSDFEVDDIFERMDYLATFSSEMGKYEMAGLGNLSIDNFMPHINKLMEALMGVTMEKFDVNLDTVVEEPAEVQTKDTGVENLFSSSEIPDEKDILKMLVESYKKNHEKDDEDGDWRKMTDEEWEKLLARVDADIEDMVERVKEEAEMAKEEQAKEELEKEAIEI